MSAFQQTHSSTVFIYVAQVLRGRTRVAPPLSYCIQTFMDVIDTKSNKTTYTKFENEYRRTHVNHPEFADFFDIAGDQLTDFAVRLLGCELLRYDKQRGSLQVVEWGGNNYSVHNKLYSKEYHVILESAGRCDCTFNCAFEMGCCHVIAVKKHLNP